jgi:hypothetical protein
MSEPTPDWVTETPDETTYSISMFDDGGVSVQNIEITREEYCALKAHLAALRGYGARPADTTSS